MWASESELEPSPEADAIAVLVRDTDVEAAREAIEAMTSQMSSSLTRRAASRRVQRTAA